MNLGSISARSAIPPWVRLALWAGGALLLAAAGAQIRLSGRAWLDLGASGAWLLAAAAAYQLLGRHAGVWPWLVAACGAGLATLGALEGQPLPALLGAAVLGVGLALGVARRPGWVRLAADSGLPALSAGAGAVLLHFPGRPILGTWMIPLVLLALPLANLAWAGGAWLARALGRPWRAAEIPAYLTAHGYTPGGARAVLIAASTALAAAATVFSRIDPFLSNIGLAALAGAACVAARPRAVRGVGLLPAAIYTYAAGLLLVFVLSLRYGFLDFLFSQTLSQYLGWDYFLLPQAFECWLNGVSPYLPDPPAELCKYGPWATPFVLHPLMVFFPGALLHALPPWISYSVFVAFSIASLLFLYALLARLAEQPLARSLIFLALVANWPLYLMLWLGQTHVFTVLAFGLVEFWLLRQALQPDGRRAWALAAGLLVSLFSKPLILLFLPALLIARLTRRPAFAAAAIYAVVSALFVLAPPLNPGGPALQEVLDGLREPGEWLKQGNLYHWGNILSVSGSLNTNHRDIHVLSTLLNVALPDNVVIAFNRLLLGLTVLWVAWLAALRRPPAQAARSLALSGTLLIALYYLAYTFAFEHQYPTLAIVPAAFLILIPRLEDRAARRYLWAGTAAYLPMLLPTIYRLLVAAPTRDIYYDFSAETLEQMTVYRAFRVVPVLVMFICNFAALRRLRLAEAASASAPAA